MWECENRNSHSIYGKIFRFTHIDTETFEISKNQKIYKCPISPLQDSVLFEFVLFFWFSCIHDYDIRKSFCALSHISFETPMCHLKQCKRDVHYIIQLSMQKRNEEHNNL